MYDWAELRHFKYLLAILEKNGFRAAADVLHTTQPNLSAQAKQFQENSGLLQEWPYTTHSDRRRVPHDRQGIARRTGRGNGCPSGGRTG
jgi:hypothetical protein